ncbi:hypothetical protein [Halopelagius longus]|uniref:Uncharacterized protein n=1 Tax=Halopelagius longus TaxID=1236180 RepID=A0A1H1B5K3_9EURY|nr:hypothetical protein [Halopelagius longus]RDI70653.1 hypothetical protein DWB78_02325 [Halopelagius longus]SDQ47192.1 hypothetical protein SAMN05216278_1648 [Halopelagius longus]
MSRRLGIAVFVLVAGAGVLSSYAAGGDTATMASWAFLALVPAAIVGLASTPSGYSDRSD